MDAELPSPNYKNPVRESEQQVERAYELRTFAGDIVEGKDQGEMREQGELASGSRGLGEG